MGLADKSEPKKTEIHTFMVYFYSKRFCFAPSFNYNLVVHYRVGTLVV